MLARLAALLLGVVPIAASAADGADKMAIKAIQSFCTLGGDSSIPYVIDQLQRVSKLLPSIPAEERKAQDERAKTAFWEGYMPPPRPAPVEDDLKRLSAESARWRYANLARVLSSLHAAQSTLGYILLDPKESSNYVAAGKLVASTVQSQIGWQYQSPEAQKLYRASFAADSLGSMETAVQNFVADEDAHGDQALVTEPQRKELQRLAGGFVSVMANYIRCKLINVAATMPSPEH